MCLPDPRDNKIEVTGIHRVQSQQSWGCPIAIRPVGRSYDSKPETPGTTPSLALTGSMTPLAQAASPQTLKPEIDGKPWETNSSVHIWLHQLQHLGIPWKHFSIYLGLPRACACCWNPSRHSSLKEEILFIETHNNQVHSAAGLVIEYFEGFQRGFSGHRCLYQTQLNESEAPIIAIKWFISSVHSLKLNLFVQF